MMASILELNSDLSDSEDDCDYVPPEGEVSDCSGNDVSSADDVDEGNGELKKKKRKGKRKGKSKEVEDPHDHKDEEIAGQPELSAEEAKKRADELWASFKKDVPPIPKRQTAVTTNLNSDKMAKGEILPETEVGNSKVIVTEEFEFAGETVKVTKEVDSKSAHPSTLSKADSLLTEKKSPITKSPTLSTAPKRPAKGLSSVLGVLSKKPKLSTLQKTMLDWNTFKREEGIEEELKHHNKGKGGFLEKQAFLQRSDLRQFEIEKNVRLCRRTKP